MARGLTKMQEEFCQAFVFMTNFDGVKASELVGFDFKDRQKRAEYVRALLKQPRLQQRIATLIGEHNDTVVVDKRFVLEKLKSIIAENEGKNYNAQLRALELLGNHLGLFKEDIESKVIESKDPSELAKSVFEKRKAVILKLELTKKEGEANGTDAKITSIANSK